MTVLVTGGTGLIGSALAEIKPDWKYLCSKDCDLLNTNAVDNLIKKENPDVVIHLAADVGGLFKNQSQRLSMYERNLQMNNNVITSSYKHGIKRLICCLSTCVFPDGLGYTMSENDLHRGEPHESNFGYAYAKRMMEVHCRLVNQTAGYNYQCITPTNIYGPNDNFNLENSHVIPGLIHKAFLHHQLRDNTSPFIIKGDGTPLRQFIHSSDLAKIIVYLVENDIKESHIICSPDETKTVSIMDVAKLITAEFGIRSVIAENEPQSNGQISKTVSNKKLMEIMPDLEFKSLEQGISETCDWFLENYQILRK